MFGCLDAALKSEHMNLVNSCAMITFLLLGTILALMQLKTVLSLASKGCPLQE